MSVNQTTKPITAEIDGEGILKIGGCSTVELVKRYQSPLYVIDEASIRKVCQEYLQAFERYNQLEKEDNEDKKFCPMYACKAQCNMAVAKIIASERFGFDAVSKGELYTLHKAGIDMNKVLFNGNNKTEDELRLAMMVGVGRYSVDNFLEIENLSKIATEFNQETNILLRITPNIECHTHEYIKTGQIDSKFGFDLNQIDEAIELIKNSGKNIKLRGLHAHIGSQIFEPISYMDEVEILFSELDRIRKKHDIILDEINIGGGLGVKYIESDNPPSIEEIANCILEKMEYCIKKYEMKATFNICSGHFNYTKDGDVRKEGQLCMPLSRNQAKALFSDPHTEVASHGQYHPALGHIAGSEAMWDIGAGVQGLSLLK